MERIAKTIATELPKIRKELEKISKSLTERK